jgi:hypothetical protein
LVLVSCLVWSFGRPVAAQDDVTKARARALGQQGIDAAARGEHDKAQDLFRRAYTLVPAPTLALREARSLVALGRLVDGMEAYLRATRTRLGPDSSAAFREAVKKAEEELALLRPRVPRLEIRIVGIAPDHAALRVSVDGRPWPPALLGVAGPIDPGEHEVVAETRSHRDSKRVTLAEGASESVQLELPAEADSDPNAGDMNAPLVTRKNASGNTNRTLAYVGFGVGAAGLAVGVVSGVIATRRHSSAEDSCPSAACSDDVDAFRRYRTISTVGYVVGVVGVGAGVTLWLTAPKKQEPAVGAFLGPSRAGIRGRF